MQVTENALTILKRRYLRKDSSMTIIETPTEMAMRVAKFVAAVDQVPAVATAAFFSVIDNLYFLPNSPTLMNAGRADAQLSACFVLPIEDHMEGIFDAIKNMALVQKTGGGTGFSFSRLRPSGANVNSTYGVASGPVSFMRVFNAATEEVKQGGTRRGANMGILRIDHPDIVEFINCKQTGGITNFNISVAVTDEFMACVVNDASFGLRDPHTGEVVQIVQARELFDKLVHNAWLNGDPGIVFLDEINKYNPTPHLGDIEATNPCGEQPLLPNEACCLGSVNLAKMLMCDTQVPTINWDLLGRVVRVGVRFLDDVIDAQTYPLPQIETRHKGNRKIGLGVMGWADMLIQLEIPYGSDAAVELAKQVASFIKDAAYEESERLGKERGLYPNYQEGCPKRRNATVTTIAPTGTISMIAGASSGIEPIFAVAYTKTVMDKDALYEFNPYFAQMGYSKEIMNSVGAAGSASIEGIEPHVQEIFAGAMEITHSWHIAHQAAWQQFTDNAVSKTINLRSDASIEAVRDCYLRAWRTHCKGITVFRDGCKGEQVLTVGSNTISAASIIAMSETPEMPPETVHELTAEIGISVAERPMIISGKTAKITTAMGSLYVTLNTDREGKPFECFIEMGKAGSDIKTFTEALARLASISMRAGISLDTIIKQLKDIRGTVTGRGPTKVLSVPDGIAKCLIELMQPSKIVREETETLNIYAEGGLYETIKITHSYEICPECGFATYIRESGCGRCTNDACLYSACS